MATKPEDQLKAVAASGDVDQLKHLLHTIEPVSDDTAQTLLTEAAWKSQLSVVEFLIAEFPATPLHEDTIRAAVYSGSIPLFQALMSKDPSVVKIQFDRRGTPLIIACMGKQSVEFLRFLLEAGADPNQDPDAASFPLALVAAFYTDTSAVDLLLEHGAKLERSGALCAAAQCGNELMVRYFLQRGAKPETDATEIGTGQPPLHVAARKGHVGVSRILLDHGADASVVDSKGMTAKAAAEEMEKKGHDMSEILELLRT